MNVESNLAVCPNELLAADPNAGALWAVFLKRVGLHINSRGEVIENDGKRAGVVRRFGVRSLLQRLPAQKTERDRARIWWRESIACSEGDSDIPDLASSNLYVLNAFIVTPSLKYRDPRIERLRAAGIKSEEEKRAAKTLRQAAYRARKRNPELYQSRTSENVVAAR